MGPKSPSHTSESSVEFVDPLSIADASQRLGLFGGMPRNGYRASWIANALRWSRRSRSSIDWEYLMEDEQL